MKNVKWLGLTLAFALALPLTLPIGQVGQASAQERDEADGVFLQFLSSDTGYEDGVEFSHSPLYDENLEVGGRQYQFTVGGVDGYALLSATEWAGETLYAVEELFYEKSSPFAGCSGLPVYVEHGTYFEYKNEAFYDVATQTEIPAETVAEIAETGFRYFGATNFVEQSETITYATKVHSDGYAIPRDLPDLTGRFNGSGCANTAGAVIITYYDRFQTNLIPDFTPYFLIGGGLLCYRTTAPEVINVVETLRDDMGTVNGGTTFSQFEAGMRTYASRQGYTYSSSSVLSWGSFDFNKYKTSVDADKPVALFFSGFSMLDRIETNGTADTIVNDYAQSGHVMVGCGYKYDTYYNSANQVISTRYYLKVASGLPGYGIGYLNIQGSGNLDKAISVTIS